MHMFYRVMKGIYQFAANLLSYIPTKYYWNRSTSDLVIVKSKRVNFFLKHSVEWFQMISLWNHDKVLRLIISTESIDVTDRLRDYMATEHITLSSFNIINNNQNKGID